MSKEKTVESPSLLSELMAFGRYKQKQGRMARQATLMSISLLVVIAAWQLFDQLIGYPQGIRYAVPAVVTLAGIWIAYRLINWPTFADFLIQVEAEMARVTWPSKGELWRSVVVVIVLIFTLAILLFVFDLLWLNLFQFIGLIPKEAS